MTFSVEKDFCVPKFFVSALNESTIVIWERISISFSISHLIRFVQYR